MDTRSFCESSSSSERICFSVRFEPSIDIVNENNDSLASADEHVPEVPTVTVGTPPHVHNLN